MKKNFTLYLLLFCLPMLLTAQEYGQISTGASYANQAYYHLATGTETQVPNESWDLAFTALGQVDAGIHVNESVAISFGDPVPELELYLSPVQDFSETIEVDSFENRLFNTEEGWENGAVNETRDTNNPFDYGWGVYNPMNHSLEGTTVYIIKLRNGTYKKFMITGLVSGAYQLRYANLDGSDEQNVELSKSESIGSLIYFSLQENTLVEVVPENWDLLLGRYTTPLDDGEGGILEYGVTGILSAPGVEVAEIRGVATDEVDAQTSATYNTRLDEIGYDWKAFDFSAGWILTDSLTYLVKTADLTIYKMVFVDFEGSSTGTATFEIENLGMLSNTEDEFEVLNHFELYPNLITSGESITMSLSVKEATNGHIIIFNTQGQLLQQSKVQLLPGLNGLELDPSNLPSGQYFVSFQVGKDIVTRPLSIQ